MVHAGTERIAFDLCVIDEIGPSADADLPGVGEHAIALRPAHGWPRSVGWSRNG